MNFSLITRCFLTLLITCILSLQATPIIDDFEGFSSGTLNGQGDWSVLSGSADVTSDDAQGGVQSVKLYGGTSALIQRDLSTFNDNPIFADLYVKMVALEGTPGEILSLDQSTLWFIKENGQGIYHVLDGDGAGGPGTSFSVPPSFTLDTNDRVAEWVRLTFRQDFLSGKWDLSINGQLAAINLGFADVASASLALNVYGDATTDTYLDTLTYGDQNPLFTDTDKDGMPDTWETAEGTDPNIDDRDGDLEPDGLTNLEEYLHGAKPLLSDSDLDGANDLSEILAQSDPNDAESYPAGHTPPPVGNLYLYEPFAYPAGSNDYTPVNSIGLTGTINLGYATDAFVADSITYGNLEVNGGAFAKTNNPYWNENSLNLNWNSDLNDRINLSTTDTETLWMSLTVKTPADLNNKSLLLTYFGWGTTYGLEIDSTTNEARAYVGTTSASARTLNPDTNYLYIAKLTIDKSTGTKQVAIDHWVYEDGETLPTGDLGAPHASIAPTPLTTDWGISSLNLSYRTPGNPGATLEPYTLDELRLGSTPDIVLPGAYTQIPQAAAPSITPESGSYDYFVQVEITTNETGGTLHYTTDGTDPDETSPQYTGPIILTNPTTLKAICIKDGMTTSGIARADYTIKTGDLHLYEPFDYPANTHSNVPATGIGLTGNLELGRVTDGILADSINVATLQTTGNHLSITNNPYWTDSGISLTWDTPFNERINLHNSSSEEMWISFTTQTPADLDGKSLSLKFFGWGDHYGIDIDNDTNQARLFIQAGGTKHTATARTLNPNTNYLHLIRLRLDNTTGPKTITLDHWIYEDAEPLPANQAALPPPHASLSQPLVTDWGVSKLYAEYRTPAAPNASLDPYTLDELRIATDYNTAAPGTHIDTDGDGMTDTWEIFHGFDPYDPTNGTADEDSDGDGLTNADEIANGTDPTSFTLLTPLITTTADPSGEYVVVEIELDPAQQGLTFTHQDGRIATPEIRYSVNDYNDLLQPFDATEPNEYAIYTGPVIVNSSSNFKTLAVLNIIENGFTVDRYSNLSEESIQVIASPSADQSIAYEPFDYTAGSSLESVASTASGFTSNWTSNTTQPSIGDGSLLYTSELGQGNMLEASGTSTQYPQFCVDFDPQTIASMTPETNTHRTFWMGFNMEIDSFEPAQAAIAGPPQISVDFLNTNGNKVFSNNPIGGPKVFGLSLGNSTNFIPFEWETDIVYKVLIKFTLRDTDGDIATIDDGTVTAWLYKDGTDPLDEQNPSLIQTTTVLRDLSSATSIDSDIKSLCIQYFSNITHRLDEIRIGTTYDSVLSIELDVDGDGLPDSWENDWFGSLAQTASGNFDDDVFTNLEEYLAGLNPTVANEITTQTTPAVFSSPQTGVYPTMDQTPNITINRVTTPDEPLTDPITFRVDVSRDPVHSLPQIVNNGSSFNIQGDVSFYIQPMYNGSPIGSATLFTTKAYNQGLEKRVLYYRPFSYYHEWTGEGIPFFDSGAYIAANGAQGDQGTGNGFYRDSLIMTTFGNELFSLQSNESRNVGGNRVEEPLFLDQTGNAISNTALKTLLNLYIADPSDTHRNAINNLLDNASKIVEAKYPLSGNTALFRDNYSGTEAADIFDRHMLNYPNLDASAGHLVLEGDSSPRTAYLEINDPFLASDATDVRSYWMSFLVESSGHDFVVSLQSGLGEPAPNTPFYLLDETILGTITPNKPVLVVYKFTALNTDGDNEPELVSRKMWKTPAGAVINVDRTPDHELSFADPSSNAVNRVYFTGSTNSASEVRFDEIRIGASLQSVIPEPKYLGATYLHSTHDAQAGTTKAHFLLINTIPLLEYIPSYRDGLFAQGIYDGDVKVASIATYLNDPFSVGLPVRNTFEATGIRTEIRNYDPTTAWEDRHAFRVEPYEVLDVEDSAVFWEERSHYGIDANGERREPIYATTITVENSNLGTDQSPLAEGAHYQLNLYMEKMPYYMQKFYEFHTTSDDGLIDDDALADTPEAPTELAHTVHPDGGVSFSWTPSTDNPINHYVIERAPTGTQNWEIAVNVDDNGNFLSPSAAGIHPRQYGYQIPGHISGDFSSYEQSLETFTALSSHNSWDYRVKAVQLVMPQVVYEALPYLYDYNQLGLSIFIESDYSNITTVDNTDSFTATPTAPYLYIPVWSGQAPTEVQIRWEPTSANTDAYRLERQQVQQCGDPTTGTWELLVDNYPDTLYADTNLLQGAQTLGDTYAYVYRVLAINEQATTGNSQESTASNEQCAIPLQDAIGQPGDPTAPNPNPFVLDENTSIIGTDTPSYAPIAIDNIDPNNVQAVFAGRNGHLAIRTNSTLYRWTIGDTTPTTLVSGLNSTSNATTSINANGTILYNSIRYDKTGTVTPVSEFIGPEAAFRGFMEFIDDSGNLYGTTWLPSDGGVGPYKIGPYIVPATWDNETNTLVSEAPTSQDHFVRVITTNTSNPPAEIDVYERTGYDHRHVAVSPSGNYRITHRFIDDGIVNPDDSHTNVYLLYGPKRISRLPTGYTPTYVNDQGVVVLNRGERAYLHGGEGVSVFENTPSFTAPISISSPENGRITVVDGAGRLNIRDNADTFKSFTASQRISGGIRYWAVSPDGIPIAEWIDGDGVRKIGFAPDLKLSSSTIPYHVSLEPPYKGLSNLMSVYPGDTINLQVTTKENVPYSGSVVWEAEGSPNQTGTDSNANFTWSSHAFGIKKVVARIGETELEAYIDLPDVGSLSQLQVGLLHPDTIRDARDYATEAEEWSTEESGYGNNTWRQDAAQHTYWNALMASDNEIGPFIARLWGRAHEHDDRYDTTPTPFAGGPTMDLHNNSIGHEILHQNEGEPDRAAIQVILKQRMDNGDMWIYHEGGGALRNWQLIKSNHEDIYE